MRVARAVVLDEQERGALEQVARGRSLSARLVERARIVLRAARGWQDQQIASELGITPERPRGGATVISTVESRRWEKMHRDQAGHVPSPTSAPPK